MKLLIVCVLLALSTHCLAQDGRYQHLVSIEASNLGNNIAAGLFLGYDYMFKHSPRGFWNAGAKVGALGFPEDDWHAYSFRASGGYNLGKKQHVLQLGIGGAYTNDYYANGGYENPRTLHYYGGPLIGYRFIGKKRFQFGTSVALYAGTHTFVPLTFSFGWGLGKRQAVGSY